MVNLNPPTVDMAIGGRQIRIHTGELLFPVLALVFCGLYYWDTRGLPDQSMIYAGPLLYATAALAVTTLFWHSISIDPQSEQSVPSEDRTDQERSPSESGDQEGVDDTASSDTDTTDVRTDEDPVDSGSDEFFNAQAAISLTVLALIYTALLYVEVPFLFASIGFLAAALYLFGERQPLILVVYSVGFAAIVWAVFIYWLGLPMS